MTLHRKRHKALGVTELIAIALGGMVGGGIFTVLGISVAMIGAMTPVAIVIGGAIASLAAYSYIKLGVYYRDEGATYSFFKKTFPSAPFAASLLGWYVIFGYISTLALYAYTFASYAVSGTGFGDEAWVRKVVAGAVIGVFLLVNAWSVKGMGIIEDIMVYTKLAILVVISVLLVHNRQTSLPVLLESSGDISILSILIVASLTFVAYEGFQLVINAVNEMERPQRNIPIAIYSAILLAILIYTVISVGAILAIPFADIIADKEYALAAGAGKILGAAGTNIVILGAVLATSSAISSTMFGASRQMAVIASDGYLPAVLARRRGQIPVNAIFVMGGFAFGLILVGELELILEFGSITFLVVSLLMAYANHRIRKQTGSSDILTILSMLGLAGGTLLILYYELSHRPWQMLSVLVLYLLLAMGAWLYARREASPLNNH